MLRRFRDTSTAVMFEQGCFLLFLSHAGQRGLQPHLTPRPRSASVATNEVQQRQSVPAVSEDFWTVPTFFSDRLTNTGCCNWQDDSKMYITYKDDSLPKYGRAAVRQPKSYSPDTFEQADSEIKAEQARLSVLSSNPGPRRWKRCSRRRAFADSHSWEKQTYTVMSPHLNNSVAKRRSIALNLSREIRWIRPAQDDLIAGDFSGSCWRSR